LNLGLLETKLDDIFTKTNLSGFYLRPLNFQPTFQKHAGVSCGGYQIHVLDRKTVPTVENLPIAFTGIGARAWR
jgi:uncharacterized protein YbbC (DUF1343 family)